jgi:serine protease Do
MQEVSSELAEQFNLEDARGVLVADILPDSPAEDSDLRRGDIITLVDGEEFDSPNDFRNIIAAIDPGTETGLTVVRDGRTRRVSVTIGSREEDPQVVSEDMQSEYGWQLDDLSDDVASRIGASGVSGVVVLNVVPGGRASVAGVQPGDIIQEVNRHTVKTLSEAGAYLSETVGDALLLVWRRGRTMYMVI